MQLPPPPPPAHHLHPESGAAALLSVANDRVSNMRDLHPARPNKRTRNARSRSPSEDTLVPALPAINSEWGLSQDNQGMGRYGRNIRHLQNPPPPSSGLSQQDHHQQYHSMHQQQQQHPGHGFQYTPLFLSRIRYLRPQLLSLFTKILVLLVAYLGLLIDLEEVAELIVGVVTPIFIKE